MNEQIWRRIEELQAEVSRDEEALRRKRQLVNDLRAKIGAQPFYTPEELQPKLRGFMLAHQRFGVGAPLAVCIRQFLGRRAASGLGPVSLEEIFWTFTREGFDFRQVSVKSTKEQMRGLAITLGRNKKWFVRTADGQWELARPNPDELVPQSPLPPISSS
jgi:hypothetical protein